MTDTELLKDYIKESGYKQSFIAHQLGLTSYGFALKRDNKSEFLPSEIETLCELLKIDTLEERFNIFFANKVEFNATPKSD